MKSTRNLIERIATVFVAAPFLYWLLLRASPIHFQLVCIILASIAALEWGKLFAWEYSERWSFAIYNITIPAIIILWLVSSGGIPTNHVFWITFLIPASILWLFFVPLALYCYGQTARIHLPTWLATGAGMMMLLGFILAVMVIYRLIGGIGLLGLFVIIWSSDIGAYFTGQMIGKKKLKLTENISPNKTLEGFIGGFVSAMAMALALYFFLPNLPVSLLVFLPLSAVAVIYGALGDLWESMLKRRARVKDSGNILPGHGGILDRIDSWLPAMVIWALGFLLFADHSIITI